MQKYYKYIGYILYAILLFIPGWVFFSVRGSHFPIGADTIYPLIGLYAFTFMAVQFVLGSNMRRLRPIYPKIMQFHRWQGLFTLLFTALHPMLILTAFGFETTFITHGMVQMESRGFVWWGIFAFDLMLLTVVTAVLAWKYEKLTKVWRTIHLFNYLVFAFAWVHSWNIGSDIQQTSLKYVWIFYGIIWLVSLGLRLKRQFSAPSQDTLPQ